MMNITFKDINRHYINGKASLESILLTRVS